MEAPALFGCVHQHLLYLHLTKTCICFHIHFLPVDPFETVRTGPVCLRQVYELMITSIAPLLIYHIECQGPARGLLKVPLNREPSSTPSTTQEAAALSARVSVCV